MPTTAAIRFDGVGTPKENYKIGDTVNLTNNDNTGVSTWAWTLLAKPAGSTAVIASPTSAATSFVVDKEGSYLVRLVVNDTLPDEDQDTGVARILHQHTAAASPAKDETGEGDPTEGWAFPHRRNFSTFDKRLGLAERRTVQYIGANTTGPKVLTVVSNTNLVNGDIVPMVDIAGPGISNAGGIFLWDGGALNTNDVVSALVYGVSAQFADPDTLVLNDAVYLTTAGGLTKTPPAVDATRLIGWCVGSGGGFVKVWFDPQPRTNNLTAPLAAVVDGAGLAGTSPSLAHSDHRHPLVTSSAVPTSVTPDVASVAGTAGNPPSRENHTHNLVTSAATPAAVGTAAPGTAGTAPSRGDHVHAHGNQLGGSLHAQATTSVDGFMSAADKTKLDGVGPSGNSNYIINGALDVWQRGTSFTVDQIGVGIARAYTADRFFGFSRHDIGGSNLSGIFTKQSGAAGHSRFSIRVQKNGATSAGFVGITQEVDRRLVEQLRGKKVTLRFRWKNGAGQTGAPLVTINTNGPAGTEHQWWGTYGAGAEHQAWFLSSPGTSFVTQTLTTTSPLPSDIVGLSFNLGCYHDFNIGGGATDFLEFAEISVVPGETAPSEFAYAGGVYENEVSLCKHFYDKSYELDTPPGSNEYNSAFFTKTKGNGTILNGEEWYLQPRPKFHNEMRVAPTVSLWTYIGTAGSWQIFDANRASVAIEITKKQFTAANNTGGNVVLGASDGEDTYGAWAADAEI